MGSGKVKDASLTLKEMWLTDFEETYKLCMSFPKNENGFNNAAFGMKREQFARYRKLKEEYSNGENLPDGFVPDTTYVLVRQDGRYLGLFNLRHELNDFLREGPGHIGYIIRKEYRGQGYATAGLALTVRKAREMGIRGELYLSVHKDNPASLKVMLDNGGYIHHENAEEYFVRIPERQDTVSPYENLPD